MYRDLGFIRVAGALSRRTGDADREGPAYAYLVYAHKPIVAYVPASGRLLSEYCVEFPDLTGQGDRSRLPASDDVLAKWMALTSDESRVIGRANMHLVGRQLDPARVRRDLWRLAEWERRRSRETPAGAREHRPPRGRSRVTARRARPRRGPRLPEGHRLRRRGPPASRSSASPTPGRRPCPATSTCGAWPSG